jgi:hypothetical protein
METVYMSIRRPCLSTTSVPVAEKEVVEAGRESVVIGII